MQVVKPTSSARPRARVSTNEDTSSADEVEEAEELGGGFAGGGHDGGEVAGAGEAAEAIWAAGGIRASFLVCFVWPVRRHPV